MQPQNAGCVFIGERRNNLEDSKIIQLYWDRDEEAILQTQIKYERYLTKVAYNILYSEEDSAETVNDTYLHAWNAIPPHRPEVLSAFLSKITRRLSIDLYRKKNAGKRGGGEYEMSLQELAESGFEPGRCMDNESEYQDLGKLISEYLRTISPDMRNVFISRYYRCDNLQEICDNFGFSPSKVKSMLFRARNGLADYLKKEGYEA